jgi:hypothetical protein
MTTQTAWYRGSGDRPGECAAPDDPARTRLSFAERAALDAFLAPIHTWALQDSLEQSIWRHEGLVAPRFHRDGTWDLVTVIRSPAVDYIRPWRGDGVAFTVDDRDGSLQLQGYGVAVRIVEAWERVEVLTYLRWRSPHLAHECQTTADLLLVHPTWWRYQSSHRPCEEHDDR